VAERPAYTVETIGLDLPPIVGELAVRLRDAGLPLTPARAADLARALVLVRPVSRTRLYWAARSVVVSDPTEVPLFDAVFFSVFGHRLVEQPQADEATTASSSDERRGAPDARQEHPGEAAAGVWSTAPAADQDEEEASPVKVPLALASEAERLSGRRFDALQPGELAQLHQLMSRLRLATPPRLTRRYRSGRGPRTDLRRTLRDSRRTGGDPVRLAQRRRRVVPRRLVMLCDISGSMEPYSRAYLQFLTCAAAAGPDAEAFVFATRLTRITRALASRSPERAIQRAAAAAPDWSSGTRIGDALKTFNDRHGRRGMARGAVVVILSDGWERGDPELVEREMGRLARLAHRIVWVNPRMVASGFAVRAGGMVAALPHCDALVSGHSFAALAEVVEAIGASSWDTLPAPGEPVADGEQEGWASATPVPGSSVAMPSGYGPSKGNTTPGWVTDE
jgi:uncharacterized protein